MDTPGKDSWRLTKAGSQTVVIISPDEMGQITRLRQGSNRQLLALAIHAALCIRPDIIIIDGFASMLHAISVPLLTIVMAKNENDLSRTMRRVPRPVFAISGQIAETASKANRDGIPIFKYPADRQLLLRALSKTLQLT
jgi:molybdopterin-guanine dinucleotide biosynthesis protein